MNTKTLKCPPFGDLDVEWHCQNQEVYHRIFTYWERSWPSIFEAFNNTAEEYEQGHQLKQVTKSLSIKCVSYDSERIHWLVAIHTNPFVGIYEIEIDNVAVVDSGVTF